VKFANLEARVEALEHPGRDAGREESLPIIIGAIASMLKKHDEELSSLVKIAAVQAEWSAVLEDRIKKLEAANALYSKE
jgi:BMFP domain-containing protein YqiC